MKLIRELDLKGDEKVLDLGCGAGSLTLQIAKLLTEGEVTGIDSSAGMIEEALPKTFENLTFLLHDIDSIDFEDLFDLVFSNAALHWVKDHEKLIVNVRKALRPGGRVRFNFAGAGNCATFFMVLRETMEKEEFTPFFSGFNLPWFMPSVEEYRILVSASALCDAETMSNGWTSQTLSPCYPWYLKKKGRHSVDWSFRG